MEQTYLPGTIRDRIQDLMKSRKITQAVRNLYTGKADARVVNRLLENNNFLKVTALIAQFLNDELAAGIAARK